MAKPIVWMLTLLLLATTPLVPQSLALEAPSARTQLKRFRTKQRAVRRKARRSKRRQVQPLGGGCSGTAIITQTDEIGRPIYPRTMAPITTQSFVFTNDSLVTAAPFASAFPTPALRAVSLIDDPPMFTIANVTLGNLVDDPDTLTVVGSSPLSNGHSGLARCPLTLGAECEVIRDFGNSFGVFDVQNLGGGEFLVLRPNGLDGVLLSVVTADGDELPLVTGADYLDLFPLGFFPRTIAARDGFVFIGGIHPISSTTGDLAPAVVRVPLAGGAPVELELDLGTIPERDSREPSVAECGARIPSRMTFLGSDLVIGTTPCIADILADFDPQPSRLLRVTLSTAGDAVGSTEISIDVANGFVNLADVAALDGQLFVVDTQVRVAPAPIPDPDELAGRILRICP